MSARERVEALFPLAPSQTGMWLQSQLQNGGALFVEQAAFCLPGALRLPALERALQTVSDRHGALRSAILSTEREAMRAVLRSVPVVVTDRSARASEEEAVLAALMAGERVKRFALNRPPLIRFAVLRVADERAWLVVTFHHVILDGWSLAILSNEIAAAYAAERAETPVDLPPVSDEQHYAAWLRARSQAAAEAFWRSRLAGFRTPNRLAARVATAAPGEIAEHAFRLSRAAGDALAAVARAAQVAPAIVVETAWALLIAGRTGTDDVAFAATVSGRPADVPGIERMVGCFINTVPIRVRFGSAETLRSALVEHQRLRAEQREFEYCAAGQIHAWSELPAHEPVCESLLVYENAAAPVPDAQRESLSPPPDTHVHGGRTAYPLAVLVSPGAEPHLRVIVEAARFTANDVGAIAGELERLLMRCADGLDESLEALRATVMRVEPPVATAIHPVRDVAPVAPRTLLEHQLAVIWRDLFKRGEIGVRDDFFALGGHSLLALQLAVRVRAELGVELPLHAIIAGPTIETLARACTGGVRDDAALIPIAPSGAGMPIACLHPLGGHVLCYAPLGAQLSGRHPVWGLQAKGLRADETPPERWNEIVDHHWELLREALARTRGTAGLVDGVALVGYSYGGYIAMELAARAREQGASQVPVYLLDVPHPSVISVALRAPDAVTLLQAQFAAALDLDLAPLRALPDDAILAHVFARAVEAHVLPPDARLDDLARMLAVAQAHSRLAPPARRYALRPTLLRAREGAERITSQPDLGWADVTDGLEIAWVDGRHETMLDPQFAAGIAARIAGDLGAARAYR